MQQVMKSVFTVLTPVGMAAVLVGAMTWSILNAPPGEPMPLPVGSVAADSPEGQAWLAEALVADHRGLMDAFQPQERGGWCGVASAVTVLGADGLTLSQPAFFTPAAEAIKTRDRATAEGLTLAELGSMVAVHGSPATVVRGRGASVEAFRAEVERNLATPGDWLLVDYDRQAVDQGPGGHIAPVAAYHPASDHLLVVETTASRYPHHWVPLTGVFRGMNATDADGGSRGWVEVGSRR